MSQKYCAQCGETKPLSDFGKNKSRKDGVQSYCRCCTRERQRKSFAENPEINREYGRRYRMKNPEKIKDHSERWVSKNRERRLQQTRASNLRRNYGITLEDYEKLLASQKGCCAVCGRHESEFKTRLAVDHDHKTGEIFGLLCSFDNRYFIGRNRDPQRYLNAAKYLSKGTGLIVPPPKKKRKKRKPKNVKSKF